jgi:hypothetical protein
VEDSNKRVTRWTLSARSVQRCDGGESKSASWQVSWSDYLLTVLSISFFFSQSNQSLYLAIRELASENRSAGATSPGTVGKHIRCQMLCIHPLSVPISKPEPSKSHALAALDVEGDKRLEFPELLLAVATVYRTIATARLQSELTVGCTDSSTSYQPCLA